jgi:hypothetical protein
VVATRDAAELARQRTLLEAELATSRARRDADFAELERRKRLELALAAIAERQQLDKLRGMAELDRELAAQDQAHVMARRTALAGLTPEQMIAMQAGELARGEGGGAAWANALAATSAGRLEAERRHAEEQRAVYDRAMGAMAQVAASRAEAAPVVAAPVISVGTVAPASPRAGTGPACVACGAAMKPDAKFCGACGAAPAGG